MRVYTKDAWWRRKDGVRNRTGKLPENSFDFISIHEPDQNWKHLGFTLFSPRCLVDEKTGKRPDWERRHFETKEEAVRFVEELLPTLPRKVWVVFVPAHKPGESYIGRRG